MKIKKTVLCAFLVSAVILASITGCDNTSEQNPTAFENVENTENTESTEGIEDAESTENIENTESTENIENAENTENTEKAENVDFYYSEGIDENGFWENLKALDYVENFNYQAIPIAKDIYSVSDGDVKSETDKILAGFSSEIQIKDRAVADGDTVNIDYVGSVGGVEFSGGSTGGMGTDVIAGSMEYIDDFLIQIIGHTPGETFDVTVTFPDNYGVDELNGQDAVFVTTINYISEISFPEITDDFIAANLSDEYEWTTVEEMTEATRLNLQTSNIQQYIVEYFTNEIPVKSIPEQLINYQEKAMIKYYHDYAASYGMKIEELFSAMGYESGIDEVIEINAAGNTGTARFFLVTQAVAESEGFSASDEDLTEYFTKYFGTDDYSSYIEQYGKPYLKQIVLNQKVLDYIVENVVLE